MHCFFSAFIHLYSADIKRDSPARAGRARRAIPPALPPTAPKFKHPCREQHPLRGVKLLEGITFFPSVALFFRSRCPEYRTLHLCCTNPPLSLAFLRRLCILRVYAFGQALRLYRNSDTA